MKTEHNFGSLYRKCRPKSFGEILGQAHIVDALKRQVASGNIAHAYLFSGSRGTGKTSTALVFAKAINCLNPQNGEPCLVCENCTETNVDIIELDAASHNSVDDVRELREFVKYSPAKGKKKVYIVDEVHMLSNAAFNALLKTLEEPPAHIVFILATTELHMIPATVQSRCQRYDFKKVSKDGMRKKIVEVAGQYGVTLEPQAIDLIVRMADGSMRDTLALLEQSLSLDSKVLTEKLVADFLGSARLSEIVDLVEYTLSKKPLALIELTEGLFRGGIHVLELLSGIIEVLRDVIVAKTTGRTATAGRTAGEGTSDYDMRVKSIAGSSEMKQIEAAFHQLVELSKFIRYSKNKESILEVTLLLCASSCASFAPDSVSDASDSPSALPDSASCASLPTSAGNAAIAGGQDGEPCSSQNKTACVSDAGARQTEARADSQADSRLDSQADSRADSQTDSQADSQTDSLDALRSERQGETQPEASVNIAHKIAHEQPKSQEESRQNESPQEVSQFEPSQSGLQTGELKKQSQSEIQGELSQSGSPDFVKEYRSQRRSDQSEGVSRTRAELDEIWNRILDRIPEEKRQILKNSQIGIFVGNEIVVHIKGLSKAREMLVEIKVKADVILAAREVTGTECNVKFEGIEKDPEDIDRDAKNVENYFKEKGIKIEIN